MYDLALKIESNAMPVVRFPALAMANQRLGFFGIG